MVTIPTAIVQHKGLMADNTTKLFVYLPELTNEQDAELIRLSKTKQSSLIILDSDLYEAVIEIIQQAKEIALTPAEEEIATEWTQDPETGFESPT